MEGEGGGNLNQKYNFSKRKGLKINIWVLTNLDVTRE